jgi:hypothetical protein
MTTPAQNKDDTILSVGKSGSRKIRPLPEENDFSYSDSTHVAGRTIDIRPASGNSDKVGGFRLCRSWDHVGGTIRKSLRDVRYIAEYDPNNIVERRFTGGCFWASGVTPTVPDKPSNNFINMVEAKALERLKAQNVHLGNFFAEAHKTVSMFSSTATTIANQVNKFRAARGAPNVAWGAVKQWETGNAARQFWCNIPDEWLELQYGWTPLLSDLTGAIMHLVNRSRFEQPFVTATASATTNLITRTNPISLTDNVQAEVQWQDQWKAHVGFVYRMNNPLLAELSSLGLLNPAEIVWETQRYSFVVDWLLPISQWLSNLTAAAGMDFVTGSWSYSTERTFKGSSITSRPAAIQGVINPPVFTGSMKIFGRRCYTSTPIPGLYVKSPISLTHALNSMALLSQAFR